MAIYARTQTFLTMVFRSKQTNQYAYLYMQGTKEDRKMNNNNYPFPINQLPGYNQLQQIQNMFPQPQGSVYAINSPLDIGNVPTGSTGLSVAICFAENLMYIKSFQNGQPVIMAYRVSPFQKEDGKTETAPANVLESRLATLEEKLDKLTSGGKFDGLL